MTEQRRTIAIATVVPLWTIHYASDLELAADHIARGDDVHILTCTGGLAACPANPTKQRLTCMFCTSVQKRAMRALGISSSNFHEISAVQTSVSLSARNVAELRDLGAGTSEAGRAAVSSLVSHVRDPEPDLRTHHALARSLYASADAVFSWTSDTLSRIGANRLYVFNGRYVNALPAVAAARKLEIPVIAHERNWNDTGFITRESGSVHSLDEYGELLNTAKQRVATERSSRSQAIQWFEGRRFPMNEDPIQRFTKNQTTGQLPEGFDPTLRNIAVFVSSEDEFVALAEWQHKFYDSQEDTIEALATHPDLDDDIRIWVRVHPNLNGQQNAQTDRLERLSTAAPSRLQVISADSVVDTYALLEAADAAIAFGSTVGAEAVYWGTPVMLLGRATYETMEGLFVPFTFDEAVRALNHGLSAPDASGALAFGSLMTEVGHRFTRYHPGDASTPPTFAGKSLRPPTPRLAVIKVGFTLKRLKRRLTRSA